MMKPLRQRLPATDSLRLGIMHILLMVSMLSTAEPHQTVSTSITFVAKLHIQIRNNFGQLYDITGSRSQFSRWKYALWSFLSSLKPALYQFRTKKPRLVWLHLFASIKIFRVEISSRSGSIYPKNSCTTSCRPPCVYWETEKKFHWLSRVR